MGVSVDSVHSHANWAKDLGGVSFPLLSDFHPKGEMARSYGVYLEDAGITDRATIVIDADGIVRHASSVTPSGQRDIAELAKTCEEIHESYEGDLSEVPPPAGVPEGLTLYVKDACGHSRRVLLALENLHLAGQLAQRNVTQDAAARDELVQATGRDQSPCLVTAEGPIQESQDIIRHLVTCRTGLWTAEG